MSESSVKVTPNRAGALLSYILQTEICLHSLCIIRVVTLRCPESVGLISRVIAGAAQPGHLQSD